MRVCLQSAVFGIEMLPIGVKTRVREREDAAEQREMAALTLF